MVDLREAELPDKMDIFESTDPYFDWIANEGIKRIVDFAFEDLDTVELGPWERTGGKGAVINIPNDFLPNDAHLIEIKAGGKSEPEHHMYEEVMYIVSGRGATSRSITSSPRTRIRPTSPMSASRTCCPTRRAARWTTRTLPSCSRISAMAATRCGVR